MSQKNVVSTTMNQGAPLAGWRHPLVAIALVVVLTLTTRLEAQTVSAAAKGKRQPAAIVRPQAATKAQQLKDEVVSRLERLGTRRGWNFPVLDVIRRMSPDQVSEMVNARRSSVATRGRSEAAGLQQEILAGDVRGLELADCLLLPQNGLLNPALENLFAAGVTFRAGERDSEGVERGQSHFGGHRPAFFDWDGDGDLDAFVGIPSISAKRTTGASLVEEERALEIVTGEPGTILYYENVTGEASSPFPPDVPYFVPDYTAASPVAFLSEPLGRGTLVPIGNPAPALADLDGDEVPELYVGDQDGKVRVYEAIAGRGVVQFSGDFEYLQVPIDPMRGVLEDLDVGTNAAPAFFNVDGDAEGELELFVGRRSVLADEEPIYLYSRADARGGAPLVWEKAEPEANPFADADLQDDTTPAFADIDGDGDLEAFVGAEYSLSFFENLGPSIATGTIFEQRYLLQNPLAGASFNLGSIGPAFADLDGDGDLDVFLGAKASVGYIENRGTNLDPAFLDMGLSPEFADLDGDGDLDVLASGYLSPEPSAEVPRGEELQTFLVYFENVGSEEEPIWERRLDGEGAISPVAHLDIDNPFVFSDLVDIDDDGDLDLFLGDKAGMRFFLNIGTPMVPEFEEQFGADNPLDAFNEPPPPRSPSGNQAGPTPDFLGIADPFFADIDGDSDLDLLLYELDSYSMRYFRNDDISGGDAVLDGAVFVERTGETDDPFASVLPGHPWLADIDHDGDLDLFVGLKPLVGRGGLIAPAAVVQHTNAGDATNPLFTAPKGAFWLAELVDPPRGPAVVDVPGPLFPFFFASPAVVDIDADGDLDGFLGFFGGNEAFIAPGGLVVTPESVITTELGGEDTITVVLKSAPLGDVAFDVEVDDGTEATVLPTSLTFTQEDWNEPHEITVTGADDLLLDGDQPFQVTISPAPLFRGDQPENCVADVVVTGLNIDNEALMADVVASKTVSGDFAVGGTVTYIVTLTNNGAGTQSDNMGPEFVDMMPGGVVLQSVVASTGTAEIQGNDVVFNGEIPPGGSVTITATALVVGVPGDEVINQGSIFYDGNGSGGNNEQEVTDDPSVAGPADPTVFLIEEPVSVLEIPTMSGVARWALGGLLALLAFVGISRNRP